MAIGITNMTGVTMDNITSIANATSFPEFIINVNHTIYTGVFVFVLLWVLWIILFIAAQKVKNEILRNGMYSGAVVSVISFFLRAITIVQEGVIKGMITDVQMWIFPILTIIIGVILWGMKK